MYSCSTLFSKYLRRYGPLKYKFNCLQIKIGRRHYGLMIQTWISVISQLYTLSAVYVVYTVSNVYFNCTLISYVHGLLKQCLISVRKWHALPFILCYELNSVHVTPQISKDLFFRFFFNHYHIQCVYNHSTARVVIF
jgi:hypothetical protein